LYYFLRLPFVRALGEHNFEGFGFLWRLVGGERRGEELLAVDVGVSVQFFSLFHANCEAHLASGKKAELLWGLVVMQL